MSRLTFVGWLKLELVRMSGGRATSLHKLAIQAQEDNPRLAEPLLLFAMETGAAARLMSYISDRQIEGEYREILELCRNGSILELEEDEESNLPWSYQKLLSNWRSAEGKAQRIENSKRLRLERSLQLMKEKHVTNAQVYQALRLNPGNTNAYLKHRDTSKLSLENTTRIMKYLYEV
ncbi:MAG: hypothetical protein FWF91_08810 [Coriobacteriia bacterium]|nr:hypothetical protein [Coriobacteriia bacterium]